jgi:hypothetical protein
VLVGLSPGLMFTDQSSILKFRLAHIFVSKKSTLILSNPTNAKTPSSKKFFFKIPKIVTQEKNYLVHVLVQLANYISENDLQKSSM